MIGKRGKIMILFYVIFLIVLFLMCSTDLIIREPEKEVYQIAVIIEDIRDDNYSNFRKGMEQAAIEYNADVHFITLYEKLNAAQQMELISREEQDGADALIVVPVDEKSVLEAVNRKQINIPVVILGTEEAEEKTAGMILIDYREMGVLLAEKMKERIPDDCRILLLKEADGQNYMSRNFLEGAEEKLKEAGYSCRIAEMEEREGYTINFETFLDGKTVLLAGDPEILSKTSDILAGDSVPYDRIAGLYGRGSTQSVLNDLDQGLITGICVTDEFSRGYFSVSRAIEVLEKKSGQEPLVMDSYYIEKEDLREPKYEKILFPME